MRSTTKFLIPLLGSAALLAGCGGSSKSSNSTAAGAGASAAPASASESSSEAVRTASNSKLGATVLVDAHGMTLYSLSAEHGGKFICTNAACLQAWHPLAAQGGSAPKSSVGSLGTVKRPDGTEQVTYNGMPLYTFALDQTPGSARGQGFKDVGTWSAVTVAGASAAPPAASTQTTTTSTQQSESPRGAYGY
jgi:predicted lipoprotein with Yx(FWY)xxD motif